MSTFREKLLIRVQDKAAGRGLRSLASEIGISAATLSRLMRGYSPDVATLEKICEWLGVDLSAALDARKDKFLGATYLDEMV